MRAPLKPVPESPTQAPTEERPDQLNDVPHGNVPAGGSAFVAPPSLGGASLVENAREAANKLRSLLG
jgi:hypothetical protein